MIMYLNDTYKTLALTQRNNVLYFIVGCLIPLCAICKYDADSIRSKRCDCIDGSLCLSCVPCMSDIDTSHKEFISVSIIEFAILYIHTVALWLGISSIRLLCLTARIWIWLVCISGIRFIGSLGNSFYLYIIQCCISPAG